jgi:protein-S-isoprenylcysteine O-methyltransferase Ste14
LFVSERRKFWMRWRVRTGYPVAVIYWLLARPSVRSIIIGGVVAALGLLIRAASSGYLRKDRELAVSGPYARTRNPLYFGSAFVALGFALAGASWAAALLVLVYFGVFYYAVMRNEESGLRKRFGQPFEEYMAQVPLFFPRLFGATREATPSASPESTDFSWAQYRKNREYQALIGVIAGLALMGLRMWIRARFGY